MDEKTINQNYANWERRRVQVTDLFLDPDNIRLQVDVTSQEALINDLFLNEDAMKVLESIVTNGLFPDETPVVTMDNKKLTVIDGNRRVSALKVLLRPEIVPVKETQIRELLKGNSVSIKEIDVVVAPDKDAVRHFLASKHTQNTKRAWRPLRQAYFYKAELERGKTVQDLRNEYPNVNIEKFLRFINIHKIAKSLKYDSEQVSKKVNNERIFPSSTIERLYEDKKVRNFLGFDFDKDGEVKIQIDKEEFEKGFKRVVTDAVDKVIDTRILNDEKSRKSYIEAFSVSERPNTTKTSKVTTSKDFTELPPVTNTKKRSKLAPKDIQFSLQSPAIRRVLIELQEIDYHKFPNATHDLLRSFLECSLKDYFTQIGNPVKPSSGKPYVYLDNVLEEFKKKMDTEKNTELSQIAQKIKSEENMKSYTAQFLNATNHNPSVFATEKNVEDAWDTLEKLFRYILDPKEGQSGGDKP